MNPMDTRYKMYDGAMEKISAALHESTCEYFYKHFVFQGKAFYFRFDSYKSIILISDKQNDDFIKMRRNHVYYEGALKNIIDVLTYLKSLTAEEIRFLLLPKSNVIKEIVSA